MRKDVLDNKLSGRTRPSAEWACPFCGNFADNFAYGTTGQHEIIDVINVEPYPLVLQLACYGCAVCDRRWHQVYEVRPRHVIHLVGPGCPMGDNLP